MKGNNITVTVDLGTCCFSLMIKNIWGDHKTAETGSPSVIGQRLPKVCSSKW
jgi:hypothetical protein